MRGKLLLVIPPVVRMVNGVHEVEADFANNLKFYLANFSHVTFACPVLPSEKDSGILRSLPLGKVQNSDRLSYIPLPYTYREDRHLRHYLATRKLLRSEIAKADYLLFSPHAKYDWSTLAALQAIKMKRKYDMESDWVHESVQRLNLEAMPSGLNKIRKTLWMYSFLRTVKKCLSHSSVALLQGQDVFDAYKDIAPNPQKVLNVQVSSEDHIRSAQLQEKLARIKQGKSLTISYAGRMIPMKGPLDWIKAIHGTVEADVELHATWFGDGSLMPQMRQEVERLGLGKKVTFAGIVDREEIMASLRKTDIFLFCHKTSESPRCLGEALAAGCSLVGYGTAYPRELVESCGGGEFADINNWQALAEIIISLDRDRPKLAHLVEAAAASGKLLDRDSAIQKRIELIKKHLSV
jgi:glycosyltransferase involved in cell wall biosynthesis